MTDPDSKHPPEPPKDASPPRVARTEADPPAKPASQAEGRDRLRADARTDLRSDLRPDPRPDRRPEHQRGAAEPGPRPRPPKPDLRHLPPPRRDTPSNVWRADPPPAPPRRRDDLARDGYRRDEPPRHGTPADDRREGPRRAWGDAPRPDRAGERRTGPPPGRADGPWAGRDDPARPAFGPRRDTPHGGAGPRADAPRPPLRRDDRRATGVPPGPPRDGAPGDRRPPQAGRDPRRPDPDRFDGRNAGPRDDRGGPPRGFGADRPRYGGPRDDGRGAAGSPGGPRGFDDGPRHPGYPGPRDDQRGRPAAFHAGPHDRGQPGAQGDARGRGPAAARDERPPYPSGPNERPRPHGHRPDDRPDDRRRPPADRPHAARPDAPPPARPAFDPNAPRREDQRLSKVLAERGIASRREADDWIDAGWVKVDGEMAVLGARVFPHQTIDIDPRARSQQARRVTLLLHKPIGYVSGQAEDGYEPASVLVTPANHWPEDPAREEWHPGHARGIAPAGRLDIDSTGLLVLTQDGRIARQLIGEDSDVEKEYLVRVEYPSGGQFPDHDLQRLRHGLWLDGKELKPAKVSWANEDQLRFVLREGRKRQIRRMCEAVGLVVTGLKRVRIGSVVLGKLPPGQWRYLREDERF